MAEEFVGENGTIGIFLDPRVYFSTVWGLKLIKRFNRTRFTYECADEYEKLFCLFSFIG